ncbi:tape measure protein [Reichenbachiella sp.]|uniref:tape measure protein n=1 Tax=Reichenbachiella sp. TaxID=2184521 RepID=UPI003BB109F8
MTQGVQFNVLVKDLGSSPLARFAKNAELSVNRVKKITRGLEGLLTVTSKKANGLDRSIKNLKKQGELGINKSLRVTSGHLDRVTNKMARLQSIASRPTQAPVTTNLNTTRGTRQPSFLGNSVRSAAAFGGGFLAFRGISNIVQQGSELEQLKIAFDTMLGSSEKADDLIGRLNEFANTTPFVNTEVNKLSRSLLAFGFNQKELLPTMNVLGNLAAGLGKEKLPFITLAYGQVRTAARLTGMETRQFSEAGIPLLNELAKGLNKSEAAIKDMISAGEISFDDVKNALQAMTSEGGRFFNLMQKQSKTLGGRWSTFVGKLQLGLGKFSKDGIAPTLKKVVEFSIEFVDKFKPIQIALGNLVRAFSPIFSALGELLNRILPFNHEGSIAERVVRTLTVTIRALTIPIKIVSKWLSGLLNFIRNNWRWFKYLAGGILAAVTASKVYNTVLPISIAITKTLGFAYGMLTGKIKIATIAARVFNMVLRLNPVGAIITGVMALGAALVWAWNRFEKFRFGAFTTFNILKLIAQGVWNWLQNIGKAFVLLYNKVLLPLGNWVYTKMLIPLGGFFKTLSDGIGRFIAFILEKLEPLKTSIQSLLSFISPALQKITGLFQPVISFFTGVWNKVQSILSTIANTELGQALFDVSNLGLIKEVSEQLKANKLNVAVDNARQNAAAGTGTFDYSQLTGGISFDAFKSLSNMPPIVSVAKQFGNDQASQPIATDGQTDENLNMPIVQGYASDSYDIGSPQSTQFSPETPSNSQNLYGTEGGVTIQIRSLIENVEINSIADYEDLLDRMADDMIGVVRDVELGVSS